MGVQGKRGKNIHQGVEPCQVRTVGRVTCILPKPSSPLVFFQYCPLLESLPASQAPYVQLSAPAHRVLHRHRLWLHLGALLAQLTLPSPPGPAASLHPTATILRGHSVPADLLPFCISPPQFAIFSPPFFFFFHLVPLQRRGIATWETWSELVCSYLLRARGCWAARGEA